MANVHACAGFLIDYMYGHGDAMLYPNAPFDVRVRAASYSFSTTYMERGDHSGTDGKVEVSPGGDVLRPAAEYDRRKTVPLVELSQAADTVSAMERLPPLPKLPVVDLHHARVGLGLTMLEMRGRTFVQQQVPRTLATPVQQQALRVAWGVKAG